MAESISSYWENRKVLISGASGFVGKHLATRLINLGADVGVTELNKLTMLLTKNIYRCNITDYDAVNRTISRFQPEFVFHLAAQPIVDVALVAPFDTMETNIRGTYNLLDVCSKFGCVKSFVHFSTDKVYGETTYGELTDELGSTELSRLDGIAHPYNASKLVGDVLAQSYSSFSNLPISIVRSGNIYGPGDTHWERLIPYVCKQLVTEQLIELRSNGFLQRDYIYIDDVIDALLLIAIEKYNENSIYNLGSYVSYSARQVVDILVGISQGNGSFTIKNTATLELTFQHMNFDKIKRELGWEPRTMLDEGLKKTYAWYKEFLR